MINYLWKNTWLWPYESIWGVIEKFKYANVFTNIELRPILNIRGISNTQFETNHYIYRNTRYDIYKLNDFFQINSNHFSPLHVFKFNNPVHYLNQNLYYCPVCIKYGYHSFFHQLKFTDRCIFHNIKLKKPLDMVKQPFPYSILNVKREAYKSCCDEGNEIYVKFTELPLARDLIVNTWGGFSKDFGHYDECFYNNIRFINPLDLYEKSINNDAYSLINKAFINQKMDRKPVYTVSFNECSKLYSDLLENIKQWYEYRCIRYSVQTTPDWYLANTIKRYTDNISTGIIDELFSIQYKKEMCTPEHRKAIATIILAYKLTGSRNAHEAIKTTLSRFSPVYYQRNCDISLNGILEEKIDNNQYSRYISYYIFSRVVFHMFNLILNKVETDNISEVEENLYIDFNHALPNYVILTKNDTYYIYEC